MSTGLPNVKINILNNQLGSVVPSEDAVMGLVLSGVANDHIALAQAKQLFALDDAVALGLDEAYDTANDTDVYKQIRDYYGQAGRGKELWILLVSKETTLASILDKSNDLAKKLLNATDGRVRMLGVTRVPDDEYSPTVEDGMDDDVRAAILKAHELALEFKDAVKPLRIIIGGRGFAGSVSTLHDLRTMTQNRVGVVGWSLYETGEPAVGFVLGRFANRPVQRKISRVKDGDLGILKAYMTNGDPVEDYETGWDAMHNKGYIFVRKFPNKSGYYITDDPSCAPLSDDYSSLARGRVIDKAHRIAYATFVDEIQDDIEVDESGFISPGVTKSYQQKIIRAIAAQMLPDEISGVDCIINPAQNLLQSDTVKIEKLAIRPKGYAKYIEIDLGFDNPLNN